jgi:hypothetical protein
MTRNEAVKDIIGYRDYAIYPTERMLRLHKKLHVLSDRKLRNLAKRYKLHKAIAKAQL